MNTDTYKSAALGEHVDQYEEVYVPEYHLEGLQKTTVLTRWADTDEEAAVWRDYYEIQGCYLVIVFDQPGSVMAPFRIQGYKVRQ